MRSIDSGKKAMRAMGGIRRRRHRVANVKGSSEKRVLSDHRNGPSCHQAISSPVAKRRWQSNIITELHGCDLPQVHVRGCVPRVPCKVHEWIGRKHLP
jgi:hypothetical protein